MDKRIIFAVAGSGKTTYLIDQLNESSRYLIVTYTNNNYDNLKTKIIGKFGFLPESIKLYTYFTFLFSFCFKPALNYKYKSKGINFENNFENIRFVNQGKTRYYIDQHRRLYASRIAKLIMIEGEIDYIKNRIEKYFDYFFVDEVQDLAGNDFDFLEELSQMMVNQLFVGDFNQHTYDTSRDGTKNKNLHANFDSYRHRFKQMGFIIDNLSLIKSYRCSPTITEFITVQLGIEVQSHRKDETAIEFITDANEIARIKKDDKIVKLFYQNHYKYNCYSDNWGGCKGQDHFDDVCVVLNKKTLDLYLKNRLVDLPPMTKNKLYVALTRSRNNVYLIAENSIE